MSRFLEAASRRLDRFIGAGSLNESLRTQLLTEQIQAIIQLTPILAFGSACVAVLLIAITFGTTAFTSMLLWGGVITSCWAMQLRAWRAMKHQTAKRLASSRAMPRAVLNAFLMSSLWAAVPVLTFPIDDAAVRLVAGVSVVGVACASAFALSVLPIVSLTFMLPVLISAMWAVLTVVGVGEAKAMLALILTFAGIVPIVTLHLSRNFVQHVVSEAKIRQQKNIISLLLKEFEENSSDWLWELDRRGRLDRVSDRFASAAATPADQLMGVDLLSFLRSASEENEPIIAEIQHSIATRTTFHDVVVRLEHDGGDHWWRLSGKPLEDETGGHSGYLGTASDITAERTAERKINFLAHHDALTGLLNRGKFTDHLKQCVARLERYGSPFAVLYLDLDQFKSVNDSRGHLIGDLLLTHVSKRLRSAVRESDIAARLGGDEFAIILNSQCSVDDIASLASRIVESISLPYEFDEEIISIGVSIGIAIAPINGTRPDQILRNADLALYRAKAEGKGAYRFFESQMDSEVRERRMLELELRQAIEDGELTLYFQPLVGAEDKRPSGLEALVRWNHPIRGLVPPAEFIPIAEQTGLIKQIGDWTILEACLAAVRWPQELLVAVNLSAKHFQLSDIVEVVREALQISKLPPHRLELEITESLLIERPDDVVKKLTELKALGVTIAMDDFGTGYSSLSYLLKFPFDKIKIDKSFVTASSEDAVARDILRSIASLGKTLKIRITAEGVETQEQVEFLSDIACHQLQGYYFAKPLNEMDLASYFLNQFEQDVAARFPAIAPRALAS